MPTHLLAPMPPYCCLFRMCTSHEVAARYDHTHSSLIGFMLLACIRPWIRFDLPGPRKGSCGPLDSNPSPPRQPDRLRRLLPNLGPHPINRGRQIPAVFHVYLLPRSGTYLACSRTASAGLALRFRRLESPFAIGSPTSSRCDQISARVQLHARARQAERLPDFEFRADPSGPAAPETADYYEPPEGCRPIQSQNAWPTTRSRSPLATE
jgi:hypothetical protein